MKISVRVCIALLVAVLVALVATLVRCEDRKDLQLDSGGTVVRSAFRADSDLPSPVNSATSSETRRMSSRHVLRVVDPDGNPILDALLILSASKRRLLTAADVVYRESTTDGIIAIESANLSRSMMAYVSASGFQTHEASTASLFNDVNEVVLQPASTLAIYCLDAQGRPLPRVVIDISRFPIGPHDVSQAGMLSGVVGCAGKASIGRYMSGEDGVVVIDGLGIGRYALFPSHPFSVLIDDGGCDVNITSGPNTHQMRFAPTWIYSATVPGNDLTTYSANMSGKDFLIGGTADLFCDLVREKLQSLWPSAFFWVVVPRPYDSVPSRLRVQFVVNGQLLSCDLSAVKTNEFVSPESFTGPTSAGDSGRAVILFRRPDGSFVENFGAFNVRCVDGVASGMLIDGFRSSLEKTVPAGRYRLTQGPTCFSEEVGRREFTVRRGETTEVLIETKSNICAYKVKASCPWGEIRFPGIVKLISDDGSRLSLTNTLVQRFWIDRTKGFSVSITYPGFEDAQVRVDGRLLPDNDYARTIDVPLIASPP